MPDNPRKYLVPLIALQNGLCGICGDPLPTNPSDIHVDHIRQRGIGGRDELQNLRAVCKGCNLRRPKKPKAAKRDFPSDEEKAEKTSLKTLVKVVVAEVLRQQQQFGESSTDSRPLTISGYTALSRELGLSPSHIKRIILDEEFPRPIMYGGRGGSIWATQDIEEWLERKRNVTNRRKTSR